MSSKEKSEANATLRERLANMAGKDQKARMQLMSDSKEQATPYVSHNEALVREMEEIDRENTIAMKQIVDEYGWPTIAMVGEDGSRMAWLLVQHADKDVDFQEKCLGLLAGAVEKGEAAKRHFAYLTDRVLINRGKPQRFGTQVEKRDGKLVPKPVEDADNLNRRRKEYELETIEDYISAIKKLHEK